MHQRTQHNYCLAGIRQPTYGGIIIVCLSIILTTLLFGAPVVDGAMDLADEPMMAVIAPAPANIMFLLDDSESMTFEVLTADYYEGRFPNPDEDEKGGFCYIFDDDDHHATQEGLRYMGPESRKFWKSQSHEYNVMYYNPVIAYAPWPGYGNYVFPPADKEFPKRHPLKKNASVMDLDEESFSVTLEINALPDAILKVKHAHYFQNAKNGDLYLIVLDGAERRAIYYAVTNVEGSGMTEIIQKVRLVTGPPGEIQVKGYDEARQNFANWFTYHRRREYVAKAAIAEVIKNLKQVRVGILSLNGTTIVPLKPVGVWQESSYYDETTTLLQALYANDAAGDSPLREGLYDIGNYYSSNSRNLAHHRGNRVAGETPPYFPEAEGGACQQSVAVVITDGYYSYATRNLRVGNADGDHNSLFDEKPYADTLSETLADVAMHFYENDLSPDPKDVPAGKGLPDRGYHPDLVYRGSPDKASHQHMSTYAMAFGITGNLDPVKYESDWTSSHYLQKKDTKNLTYGNYPNWPGNLEAKSKETIDDLFHAIVNGRGRFFNANVPGEITDALTELTCNVLDRTGSASSLTMNNDVRKGGTGEDILMFQASYRTGDWSGDVKAYRIDSDTGEILGNGPAWSAAESLNLTPWNQRNILSYTGSYGTEFDENQLTKTQKTMLGPDYRDLVGYIKGDKIEGYRIRSTKLGDIVHSSPVLEDGILYVGANDGMLHAFDIKPHEDRNIKGDEIFAYIPSFVFENLVVLADHRYRHKYYVDLTPTVSKGRGLLGGDSLETILVGGLGKGGKGYFALNISTPGSMTAEDVLWEFPNAGSQDEINDIGYSFSKPLVVRTNSSSEDESWIVVFGNGYDSANGNAVLYVLNPRTGDVIRKIVAKNPAVDSGNGLSSPIAVDVNADKKVDFVYAGDLMGHMWKFDLTSQSAFEWKIAYNDGTYDQPLFKAQGPDGSDQPITSKPEVMLHPDGHGLMVLFGTGQFLGTSDIIDTRTQTVYGIWDYGDRVYYPGEWGDYSNDDGREYLGTFTRNQLSNQPPNVTLLRQTSNHYAAFASGESDHRIPAKFRIMSSNQPIWNTMNDDDTKSGPNLPDLSDEGTSHAGWYYDLPLVGERIVNDVQLRDGRLAVICFRPGPDPCSDDSTSFLLELNAFTGGGLSAATFDVNEDGVIDTADTVPNEYDEGDNAVRIPPAGIEMQGNLQPPISLRLNHFVEMSYLNSSSGSINPLKTPSLKLGVIYWKELER